jgi:hypothetical protein
LFSNPVVSHIFYGQILGLRNRYSKPSNIGGSKNDAVNLFCGHQIITL